MRASRLSRGLAAVCASVGLGLSLAAPAQTRDWYEVPFAVGVSAPPDLAVPSSGGIADALGVFLRHAVDGIPPSPGQKLALSAAVDYSYPLASSIGRPHSSPAVPVLVLAPTGFDPVTDLTVRPSSLVCRIETMVASWQANFDPTPGGTYGFKLTVYGADAAGAPIYTGNLRYAAPHRGTITSVGCN